MKPESSNAQWIISGLVTLLVAVTGIIGSLILSSMTAVRAETASLQTGLTTINEVLVGVHLANERQDVLLGILTDETLDFEQRLRLLENWQRAVNGQ